MATTPAEPNPDDTDLDLIVNGHSISIEHGYHAGVYYKCTECHAGFTDWDEVRNRKACGEIEHLAELNEKYDL